MRGFCGLIMSSSVISGNQNKIICPVGCKCKKMEVSTEEQTAPLSRLQSRSARSSPTKRYKKLTTEERLQVLRLVDSKISYGSITDMMGVARSTISDIVRRRKRQNLPVEPVPQRLPPPRPMNFTDDPKVYINHAHSKNVPFNQSVVREFAREQALSMDIHDLRTNIGWVQKLEENYIRQRQNSLMEADVKDEETSSTSSPEHVNEEEWADRVHHLLSELHDLVSMRGTRAMRDLTLRMECEFNQAFYREMTDIREDS